MISADGIDRAQHVRDGRDGHDLRPLGQQRIERVELKPAVVGQGDVAQHGPGPLGQLLPGDEVRVVLHLGQQDFVALAHVGVAPASRHQVDRRRSSPEVKMICSTSGALRNARTFSRAAS